MKKIAFYSPHLSERGTEVAMFDFAHYNESILGNKSIIIYHRDCSKNSPTAVEKFKKRFEVYEIFGPNYDFGWDASVCVPMIDRVISEQKCDVLYMQKFGKNEGVYSRVCKNIILCCGNIYDPHGDAYVYVSKWLSQKATNGKVQYIPIIIDIPKEQGNLREELDIPKDAIVFGRTGGMDTWNISWANNAINSALSNRVDIYFVFQNTPKLFDHPRVKYIPTTVDSIYKSRFIETCDAMIHCRIEGESFGQTCAEFSSMNKPVITYFLSNERNHIDTLQEKGIYYQNEIELATILARFKPNNKKDWNCYKNNTPEACMSAFKRLLLDKI
jgi:hypothetical protein